MAAAAALTVLGVHAQPVSPRLEFEVASVKPHSADENSGPSTKTREPGRFTYTNVTVRGLMREAWGLKVYPLSRGPDALSTDRYDVIAKGPPDATKEQVMLMLQSLLAERFKLAAHRETKELPIYRLVVGKNAPKLHTVPDDGSAPVIDHAGGHQIAAKCISMEALASTLQGFIGDKVVDATALTGRYDVTLDFNVDESKAMDGTTIFEAVQRDVGLKLEATKGPVEVIVIDHVEKPSAN